MCVSLLLCFRYAGCRSSLRPAFSRCRTCACSRSMGWSTRWSGASGPSTRVSKVSHGQVCGLCVCTCAQRQKTCASLSHTHTHNHSHSLTHTRRHTHSHSHSFCVFDWIALERELEKTAGKYSFGDVVSPVALAGTTTKLEMLCVLVFVCLCVRVHVRALLFGVQTHAIGFG